MTGRYPLAEDSSQNYSSTTLCQNNHPVEIGTDYTGEIDELAVYGRALTDAELQSLYLRELRWYRARAIQEIQIDYMQQHGKDTVM